MKKLLLALLFTLVALVFALAIGIGFAVQTQQVSRSDLAFLTDVARRDGIGAVVEVVRAHLYGPDLAYAADPSYGRELVPGRGHAPWVIRSNLDGRPRMLLFALAPGWWAAYDVDGMSLYQVWQGSVLFQGAAYDYRHGPQPISEGQWYRRNTQGARWFIETQGQEVPAAVKYLGHTYHPGRSTASMQFELRAGDLRVQLSEQPELIERQGQRFLERRFTVAAGVTAGFYDAAGERVLAAGTVALPLTTPTPLEPVAGPNRGLESRDDAAQRGAQVIAGSDCLGCHATTHRVTGPSWAQISGKYRGKVQASVVEALATRIREGAADSWGPVPMPAHPGLSDEDARDAVIYILGVGEPEEVPDPPLNPNGEPYPATRDFAILPRLTGLHPSFTLDNIAPPGFEPKVGGMDFRSDGALVVASWDLDGAVYLVEPNAAPEGRVRRIAEGLHEPLGLAVVDDRIFVLQKQELTELVDSDGDEVIDSYRAVSHDWPASANFHSFAFGLLHRDDAFYFLLSVCVLPGGASCPEQLPTQGKLLRADSEGNTQIWASGFRTPNGIAAGPDGGIYVTDNQGDWLPSSKFVRVERGDFYGSRAVRGPGVMTREEKPPAVWLPHDEVGNSPTQPLPLVEGPYAGQWIHGDVYNGGIKRVFLETVEGAKQGAVFHFSAGFQGGVNRLSRGPDGAIYVGEVGNPPNWGEYGKPWYGLERLRWQGDEAFEILAVRARADGFELELTRPLDPNIELSPADLTVRQWFYHPDEQYGGPKFDEQTLTPAALDIDADRRRLRARIPGLRAGRVVYLRLDDRLRSTRGDALWTAEAWYTLNARPGADPSTTGPAPETAAGWRPLFDGATLDGWRNYGGSAGHVRKWRVQDGALALTQEGVFPMWELIKSAALGGPSGDLIYHREKFRDFELRLEWKISENGNSGIFYLVADEQEKTPWLTGIEMQVLDNERHSDGQIETHRAGALYDLVAAQPETVRPPGEWNEVMIRVRDNRIEHWLNGVKVVDITRGSQEWQRRLAASKFADMPRFATAQSGYIVLQDHGDPVWYRNIRVRELSAR